MASTVARGFEVLDRLDAAQMTPQEFAAYAIVIGVEAQQHLPGRLAVTKEHPCELQDLRAELQRRLDHWREDLSGEDRAQIESRFMQSLLGIELPTDALFSRILGGRPLIVARADVVRRHGRDAIVQAAHKGEVAQALASSRPVHGESVTHYGLRIESASVESVLGVG